MRNSFLSVQSILKDSLSLCQIVAKFVLRLLNEEWKRYHVSTCHDLQERLERDPECLSEIITGDEMWVKVQGRKFNYYVTMFQAKLWDAFVKFQIMHCPKCFELWHNL
jgi:hypothetical protein